MNNPLRPPVLVELWISQDEYERRSQLDDGERAVLVDYTYHNSLPLTEDDLQTAARDAALKCGTQAPTIPSEMPLPAKLTLLNAAARGWNPKMTRAPSRWNGDAKSAEEFLELARNAAVQGNTPRE